MLAAGVLRLVDQEVIDAEIELVMDPRRIDIGEQVQCFFDQVVIIDQSAPLFLMTITGQHIVGDAE